MSIATLKQTVMRWLDFTFWGFVCFNIWCCVSAMLLYMLAEALMHVSAFAHGDVYMAVVNVANACTIPPCETVLFILEEIIGPTLRGYRIIFH